MGSTFVMRAFRLIDLLHLERQHGRPSIPGGSRLTLRAEGSILASRMAGREGQVPEHLALTQSSWDWNQCSSVGHQHCPAVTWHAWPPGQPPYRVPHDRHGVCFLPHYRDLMCKMSVIPDWHPVHFHKQKLRSLRPYSSPCGVFSKSGLPAAFRPFSSGEYCDASRKPCRDRH